MKKAQFVRVVGDTQRGDPAVELVERHGHRPLCPHCLKDECNWLHEHAVHLNPGPSRCPGHGRPIEPAVRDRIEARLNRLPSVIDADGDGAPDRE